MFDTDHRSFEDILSAHGDHMHGVALVSPTTPETDIARWHALGARGTRITTVFPGEADLSAVEQIVTQIKPFCWHVSCWWTWPNSPT